MATQRRVPWSPAGWRGFTIIELVLTIAVIFVLMGLLLVGVRHIVGKSKETIDRAAVTALKQSVAHFRDEFKFLPPLVKDGIAGGGGFPSVGPLDTNTKQPVVYSPSNAADKTFLRTEIELVGLPATQSFTDSDPRFSIYSLPIYLMGVLDLHRSNSNVPVDGVEGPRFKAVKRDGTFEAAGKDYNPLYDPRNGKAVFETQPGTGRFELRDSHGVAFRYYRWEKGDANGRIVTAEDCNIPELVADPDEDKDARGAEYAIVGAGPNGVFGDEAFLPRNHPQHLNWDELGAKVGISCDPNNPPPEIQHKIFNAARADNIVEYGR